MALTMDLIRIIVLTAPVDDADNTILEVLHVDSC